jgi:hypothetical protein
MLTSKKLLWVSYIGVFFMQKTKWSYTFLFFLFSWDHTMVLCIGRYHTFPDVDSLLSIYKFSLNKISRNCLMLQFVGFNNDALIFFSRVRRSVWATEVRMSVGPRRHIGFVSAAAVDATSLWTSTRRLKFQLNGFFLLRCHGNPNLFMYFLVPKWYVPDFRYVIFFFVYNGA